MPTLYEIAKPYKQTGPSGKVAKDAKSVVEGLRPRKQPLQPGYRILKPEELAALEVPQLKLNGDIEGYQRGDRIRHARAIARSLRRGEEIPPITVSLDSGTAFCTDGQHRGLGGIIARKPVPAIIKHRTRDEQARLFANQRNALPVSNDTIVLAAHGLFAEYVQEAVTSDNHAWSGIVGVRRTNGRIGAAQMLSLVSVYVANAVKWYGRELPSDDLFDRGAADRLAELLTVFGTRHENPLAWKPQNLRAITVSALKILRRTGERPADIERWKRQMPQFPFAKFAHISRHGEMATELIRHWNKRLSPSRQIETRA